jgi:hypothetical protein
MSPFLRYLFIVVCLLLLTAVVPPQPAFSHGDPDEVVERTDPLPPIQLPLPPTGSSGLRGDPDEMPEGGWESDGGLRGGPDFPGGTAGLRVAGGWIPIILQILSSGVLAAY